jgi:hypothetical protein
LTEDVIRWLSPAAYRDAVTLQEVIDGPSPPQADSSPQARRKPRRVTWRRQRQ